uniref:U-scoloptoxin(15)-Sm3a n=1 Tax=Scolopendra morsitans TaxID=943129 RepID=TXF3A_SCOMO|nr:RecName: Full=U-scoloptoxin(15)-Sm3a; Short=U-SLPTX(15)-Sm3a; Flags: Precursor [Scolopendra morsitans]
MERKVFLLLFVIVLLTLPGFMSAAKKEIPYKRQKFPKKSQCIEACANALTNGDKSKITDVKSRFYKCICYYNP